MRSSQRSQPVQRPDARSAHGTESRTHSPDRSGGRTLRSWGHRRAHRRYRSAAGDGWLYRSSQPSASAGQRRHDPAWRRDRSQRSWRHSKRSGTYRRHHG